MIRNFKILLLLILGFALFSCKFGREKEKDPEFYISLGDRLMTEQYYAEAAEQYTNAILLEPNSAETYNKRGLAYLSTGEYEKAKFDFETAIFKDPDLFDAYNNLGLAHEKLGEYDKALLEWQQLIDQKPEYANAYFNIGNHYFKEGDYLLAIDYFSDAIKLNPEDAEAYRQRAVSHKMRGEIEKAISDYKEAVDENPYFSDAFLDLAEIQFDRGNFEDAIDNYTDAIELASYPVAVFKRGVAYAETGKYYHAADDISRALEMERNRPGWRLYLATIYYAMQEYKKAYSQADRILEADKDNVNAMNIAALSLIELNKLTEAEELLDYALDFDYDSAKTWYSLAVLNAKKGNEDRAIFHLKRAVEIDPDYMNTAQRDPAFDGLKNNRQFDRIIKNTP